MGDESDPFACFGESDEDDDNIVEEKKPSSTFAAQQLIEQTNMRMAQKHDGIPTESRISNGKQKEQDNEESSSILSTFEKIVLWPKCPPLYLGPVELVSSLTAIGGGRGFVAKHTLPAGTLVLVEEPMLTWSDEQIGKKLDFVSVQHILQHPHGNAFFQDLEDFHPTKDDVDQHIEDEANSIQIKTMMKFLQEQEYPDHDDRITDLVQLSQSQNITCRNGQTPNKTDMFRTLLALRYNGLETGIYRHAAMLNHDCHPNCTKYKPTMFESSSSNSSSDTTTGQHPPRHYSEVRTTRTVKAGESLTISYLPRLMSHASRRRYLWDQHRFDIGGADQITVAAGAEEGMGKSSSWRKMEMIHGNALPSTSIHHVDESSATYRIESSITELEELYVELSESIAQILLLQNSHGNNDPNTTAEETVWAHLQALELSSLEVYTEGQEQLGNDRHLLLIPCLRLHLDASDLVLKDPHLLSKFRIKLLCRMVSSGTKLLELQRFFYGCDHFDVARTALDVAQAIEELLGRAPKQLVQVELEGRVMKTFEAWSALEHECRKDSERIQAMYPRDAEQHISMASLAK